MMQRLAISALAIIGLVTTVTLAQSVTLRPAVAVEWCFDRGDGFYQNPYDCHAFIRCDVGVKYEFDCPPGTRWNAAITTCDHIYLTACNTTQTGGSGGGNPGVNPVYCPPNVPDANQRDPEDCSRYYRCIRGTPYRQQCTQGLVYVTYTQTCGNFDDLSPQDQSFCSALPTPTTTTRAPDVPFCPLQVTDGSQRDATNCGRYYRCRNGQASLEVCPQDLYFSPTWGACVPYDTLTDNEMVFCSGLTTTSTPTTITTLPPDPLCPVQIANATQRDATNCGRYFRCVQGTRTLEVCPQDLFYNPLSSSCTPFNWLSQGERDFCSALTTTPPPTVTPTTPVAPFCPLQLVEGTQRDPTNCGRYYRCRRGIASLESCASDLYFAPAWGACVPFNTLSQVEKDFCTTIPTRVSVCPQNVADGYQRDPQDCTRYVRCVSGQSTPLVCSPGQYFNTNSVSQPCGRFEDMSASDQGFCAALEADGATTDVPCPVNGFQRDAMNCSQYYRCVNGVAFMIRCQTGLYYSTIYQTCSSFNDLSPSDKAYCSGLEVATPAPAFQCPQNIASAQSEHPTDCRKYIQCNNGVSSVVTCVTGTYYSPQTYRCDPPDQLFQDRYDECLTNVDLDKLCPSSIETGRTAHLTNCSLYIQCDYGTGIPIGCPENEYFNILTNECDAFTSLLPSEKERCYWMENKTEDSTTEPMTSEGVTADPAMPSCLAETYWTLIPGTANCTQYFFCNLDTPIEFACAESTFFNPDEKACTLFSELTSDRQAECSNAMTTSLITTEPTTPYCPADAIGTLIPDTGNCTEFFFCNLGTLTSISCPESLYFNPETESCTSLPELDAGRQAECSDTMTTSRPTEAPTTPIDPCPPGLPNNTRAPDVTDCHRYYECVDGVLTNPFCDGQDDYYDIILTSCGPLTSSIRSFQPYCFP